MLTYPLMILLQVSDLAKSVYYYTLSTTDKDDKNKDRYGYRRIKLKLRNQDYNVNHKKDYKLMIKLGLKSFKKNKRKYSSYKETVGKSAVTIVVNVRIVERNFKFLSDNNFIERIGANKTGY